MPTGYTSPIYDGTETTFRQFALRCARGMGACVMMRDSTMDAPIPERFEPYVAYYDKQIVTAQARIDELNAMSEAEREAAANEHNREAEERNRERLEENTALAARYDAMIAETQAWQGAPDGLKSFMLSQLVDSRRFDVSDAPYQAELKPAALWFADELAEAARSLRYATEQRAAEIERTNERNAWLAKLHAALPPEEKVDG